MTNVTYKTVVEYALAHLENLPEGYEEKLIALSKSFDRKASGERQPSAARVENEKIAADVAEVIREHGAGMTTAEIQAAMPGVFKSPQKALGVMRVAADLGLVRNAFEGVKNKKAVWELVEGE